MHSLRQRINSRDESGFTLIELLVVLIILGFRDKAQKTAAASDVREAIPSAEAFYSDNNTYTGMSPAVLKATYDSGLSSAIGTAKPEAAGAGYCIEATVGTHKAVVNGPGGTVLMDSDAGFAD